MILESLQSKFATYSSISPLSWLNFILIKWFYPSSTNVCSRHSSSWLSLSFLPFKSSSILRDSTKSLSQLEMTAVLGTPKTLLFVWLIAGTRQTPGLSSSVSSYSLALACLSLVTCPTCSRWWVPRRRPIRIPSFFKKYLAQALH